MQFMQRLKIGGFTILCIGLSSVAVYAQDSAAEPSIPPIEQLLSVDVTSVSKREQKAYQSSAAIYVITAEDIHRTGVTTIMDALRLAPGVHVAQAGAGGWAISSRGFNGEFANKMLVLMDGRSVYNPIFGGVYWSEQQKMLSNIERIEVIRGPAGAVWGANAMNGVINIITKRAKDTQGGLAEARFGNQEAGGGIRYGGALEGKGHYRVSVSHDDFDETYSPSGRGLNDELRRTAAEFRTDLRLNDADSLSIMGDYMEGDIQESRILPLPTAPFRFAFDSETSLQSGNLNMEWQRSFSKNSDFTLRAYYDENHRNRDFVGEYSLRTFDTEAQHHFRLGDRHDITWGVGYRYVSDDLEGSEYLFFDDNKKSFDTFSGFVQDDISFAEGEWILTLGSKFEHNDFSGFEVQPNARLSWLMDEETTLWAAVSRAVRPTNRAAEDVRFAMATIPGQGILSFYGQDTDNAESLIAYETGFRSRLSRDVVVDATLFYNDYDTLLLNQQGTPFTTTLGAWGLVTILPLIPGTEGEGSSYGTELAAYWDLADNFRLRGGYSYINSNLDVSPTAITNRQNSVPHHQFNLRSYWDIDAHHQLDAMLYYYGDVKDADVENYLRTDLRFGWTPTSHFEFSLVGQNLLDGQHQEYSPFTYNATSEMGRAVYGRAVWRF